MASPRRLEKLQRQILRILAIALQKDVSDPRLIPLVTITRVKLARDLSVAKVFYSVLGEEPNRRLIERLFQDVRGRLRTHVGHELQIRTTPELQFHYDEAIEGQIRLAEKLRVVEEELAEAEAREYWDEKATETETETEVDGDAGEDAETGSETGEP